MACQFPEQLISQWTQAFNERDLDGMLMHLDPLVDFHPLQLGGCGGSYRGHDGMRQWFARLQRSPYEHQIALRDVTHVGDGKVLATGFLAFAGGLAIASSCAVHRTDTGLITAARPYLSDPDTLGHLGLIP